MPIERDRERAKRRYARRQASLHARAQRARRNQQVAGAVLAVVVVVGGVVLLSQRLGGASTTASPGSAATTSAPTAAPSSAPATPTSGAGTSATPTKAAKHYPKAPAASLAQHRTWNATVRTNRGTLTLQLFGDKAPQTVSSFLFLARDKFYDRTSCHRITLTAPLQVLQCGDPTATGSGGPGYTYGIENAPKDGKYPAGTLAMARTQDPNSNGSQFFITYADSTLPTEGGGYSIFGTVTKGLPVLRAIAKQGTTTGEPDGAPKNPVTITSITVEPR